MDPTVRTRAAGCCAAVPRAADVVDKVVHTKKSFSHRDITKRRESEGHEERRERLHRPKFLSSWWTTSCPANPYWHVQVLVSATHGSRDTCGTLASLLWLSEMFLHRDRHIESTKSGLKPNSTPRYIFSLFANSKTTELLHYRSLQLIRRVWLTEYSMIFCWRSDGLEQECIRNFQTLCLKHWHPTYRRVISVQMFTWRRDSGFLPLWEFEFAVESRAARTHESHSISVAVTTLRLWTQRSEALFKRVCFWPFLTHFNAQTDRRVLYAQLSFHLLL